MTSTENSTADWIAYERRMHAQWMAAVPPVPMAAVRDLTIDGLRARLYRPPGVPEPSPALLYLHGGGWVLGDTDAYDGAARHLAAACTATVISLDYRRAPEHRHPAALNDTIAAVHWITGSAAELGIDPDRIGLAGDSAGGHLAVATALHLATHPGPRLAAQLLLYPALDLHDHPGDPDTLTRTLALYLGDQNRDTPDISPLTAPDLTGMPPTVIAAPEHDPLRPQAERLTERLHQARVPVHLLRGTGLQHGFLGQLGTLPAADHYLAEIGAHITAMWSA
jgi:acetyl esterase